MGFGAQGAPSNQTCCLSQDKDCAVAENFVELDKTADDDQLVHHGVHPHVDLVAHTMYQSFGEHADLLLYYPALLGFVALEAVLLHHDYDHDHHEPAEPLPAVIYFVVSFCNG